MLSTVNRDHMNVFQMENAAELKRFSHLKRSNDIFFEDTEVRAHNYSGFYADHVISLQTSVTGLDANRNNKID